MLIDDLTRYLKNEELLEKRFNKLVVKTEKGKNKYGHTLFDCLCDCGRTIIKAKGELLRRDGREAISCGCAKSSTRIENNIRFPKNIYAKAAKDLHLDRYHPTVRKAARCRHSAVSRKKEWTISPTESIKLCLTACYYCKFYEDGKIGIDRLNSELGYIDGNCVPCCKNCNFAKNDMTLEEFRDWLKRLWYNYGVSASAD